MKHKILFGIIFLIVWVTMASGCAARTKIVDSELERNRRLWEESKIVNYNFEIYKMTMGTWGIVPSLIQVRNSQTTSNEPISEKGVMQHYDSYEDFETVEKAFDTIQKAFDRGDRVEVRYNKVLGYPEKTIIDPNKAQTDMLVWFEITKFEIIETN